MKITLQRLDFSSPFTVICARTVIRAALLNRKPIKRAGDYADWHAELALWEVFLAEPWVTLDIHWNVEVIFFPNGLRA
jgi:hypothetical protein